MTYYQPPADMRETRLECLKLAAEFVGPLESSAEDIVAAACVFETYVQDGK